MSKIKTNTIIKALKQQQVIFELGLTNNEVDMIEEKFKFTFPPDLKELLQKKLPVSGSFVNWRKALKNSEYREEVKNRLKLPLAGILFDVKHNQFWLEEWGDKPTSCDEQESVAKRALAKAPKLIPIMSHRYIPADPQKSGNPIFSVHQTDIICYGTELLSYFSAEFGFEIPSELSTRSEATNIRFWSKFAAQA